MSDRKVKLGDKIVYRAPYSSDIREYVVIGDNADGLLLQSGTIRMQVTTEVASVAVEANAVAQRMDNQLFERCFLAALSFRLHREYGDLVTVTEKALRHRLEASQVEVGQLVAELTSLKEELQITKQIAKSYERVFEEIPDCAAHGAECVSHAVDYIKRMHGENEKLKKESSSAWVAEKLSDDAIKQIKKAVHVPDVRSTVQYEQGQVMQEPSVVPSTQPYQDSCEELEGLKHDVKKVLDLCPPCPPDGPGPFTYAAEYIRNLQAASAESEKIVLALRLEIADSSKELRAIHEHGLLKAQAETELLKTEIKNGQTSNQALREDAAELKRGQEILVDCLGAHDFGNAVSVAIDHKHVVDDVNRFAVPVYGGWPGSVKVAGDVRAYQEEILAKVAEIGDLRRHLEDREIDVAKQEKRVADLEEKTRTNASAQAKLQEELGNVDAKLSNIVPRWQSMETAPKDVPILAVLRREPYTVKRRATVIEWSEHYGWMELSGPVKREPVMWMHILEFPTDTVGDVTEKDLAP